MISDFHNDVLTSPEKSRLLKDYGESENKIVCAFFKGDRSLEEAVATSENFLKSKKDNLYLAFEDVSYTTDISELERLFDLDPVYVSLTWNGANAFAGGAYSDGNITKAGARLVFRLNERKIAVDLAHLSVKSFFSVLSIADEAVCSHTCFCGVNAHPRNLSDEQIKALVEKKALIGLAFYRPFLTDEKGAGIEAVVRHIDYYCERFPSEYLCLGTDLNGCEDLPENCSDYGFESLLKEALTKRGYSERTIDGILYRNLSEYLAKKS